MLAMKGAVERMADRMLAWIVPGAAADAGGCVQRTQFCCVAMGARAVEGRRTPGASCPCVALTPYREC
jgi:hypothetical protein